MKIEKVALLGAGAIGAYFVDGLSDKMGENFMVVAEGARGQRLSEQGMTINGKSYPLHVRTPEEAGGVDLLVVALKYGSLPEALPQIEKVVDEHTIVLSPMNGVDSEEIIGERVGREHLVYSVIKIASSRRDGQFVYNPAVTPGLFIGEKDRSTSERILAIRDLCEGTPLKCNLCDNIEQDIWFKYALNISRNLPQAIVGCGFGAYAASTHLSYIRDKLREEVVRVAAAKGVDISDSANPVGKNTAISPDSRFSTLQDLDAKRQTEIEMFSGTLVRMGRELGVETPYNDLVYHIIKTLEEKNAGKIR